MHRFRAAAVFVGAIFLMAQQPSLREVPAPAPPKGTVEAWTMTVKTTIDSGTGIPKFIVNSVRISPTAVRMEFESNFVSQPAGMERPAMITDDSAHLSMQVYEKGRRAVVSSRPNSQSVFLSFGPASRFISGPVLEMHDLGAGEQLLGHPTHKYSYNLSFAALITVGGLECRYSVHAIEEIWAAADLPRDERVRRYVSDRPVRPASELGPVLDSLEKLRVHRERLINGFVLRTRSTNTRGAGTRPVVTTTEVTELSHGPVARSVFAIPEGYPTMTIPTRTPAQAAAESTRQVKMRSTIDSMVKSRLRATICDPA